MSDEPSFVILTGAGISAESGLQTFRAPEAGMPALWADHDVEDVATPEGYRRDPELVHAFYSERRTDAAAAEPNAAHLALGQLSEALGDRLLIVTQNIDDLHERGGARPENLIHMHGQLSTSVCTACFEPTTGKEFGAPCDVCRTGVLRPDIVFFGEQPRQVRRIEEAIASADGFIAIGTSGHVYPAAGFVDLAHVYEVDTLEMNLVESGRFTAFLEGPASQTVPAFASNLMGMFTAV